MVFTVHSIVFSTITTCPNLFSLERFVRRRRPESSLFNDRSFQSETDEKFTSSIWGPTCDGLDCIQKSIRLPKLEIGEWIYWKNMGAYTISAAVQFNGLPFGKPLYFMSKQFW